VGGVREQWSASRTRWIDTVEVQQRFDSIAGRWETDSTPTRVQRRYLETGVRRRMLEQTDLALAASSQLGALGLSLAAGTRHLNVGDDGGPWLGAGATWALRPDVGVAFQASRLAGDALRGLPGRRELRLGVVLRPWGARLAPLALPAGSGVAARRFAAERAADGRTTLVVHAPGARSVEVMADFTGWRILALERDADGAWRLALEVARGVHQVNLRIDGGEWLPPPGLGVGDDGFGGKVGLLVL
jgi:hypothetical protein